MTQWTIVGALGLGNAAARCASDPSILFKVPDIINTILEKCIWQGMAVSVPVDLLKTPDIMSGLEWLASAQPPIQMGELWWTWPFKLSDDFSAPMWWISPSPFVV